MKHDRRDAATGVLRHDLVLDGERPSIDIHDFIDWSIPLEEVPAFLKDMRAELDSIETAARDFQATLARSTQPEPVGTALDAVRAAFSLNTIATSDATGEARDKATTDLLTEILSVVPASEATSFLAHTIELLTIMLGSSSDALTRVAAEQRAAMAPEPVAPLVRHTEPGEPDQHGIGGGL